MAFSFIFLNAGAIGAAGKRSNFTTMTTLIIFACMSKAATNMDPSREPSPSQTPMGFAFTEDTETLYAEIIVPLYLPKNYTWEIPADLAGVAEPGMRAEVALRNKRYTGIIKKVTSQAPVGFVPKPVLSLLDKEPLITKEQLRLWNWMASYYLCTEGDVMQAAVPSNFKLSSESILSLNEDFTDDYKDFTDEEYLVTEALSIRKELRFSEIQQILDTHHIYRVVKKLLDKGVCFIWEELRQKYTEKKARFVSLHPDYRDEAKLETLINQWSGAKSQFKLLLVLIQMQHQEGGQVLQPELLKKAEVSHAVLKALEAKNIIFTENRSLTRLPSLPKMAELDFTLTPLQQNALTELKAAAQKYPVNLLHGVTASGKTQLYLTLMDEQLSAGRQVLYMLPEIALTAQIIRRLQKHFGGNVAVYHSKFNPNERVELWQKVKSGEVNIILGARSALLLPFADLGLIIVDEEHEASYKQQEPAPRYNARDTAIFYASLFKDTQVLLGSATPSLETYYNCQQGKYGLVSLLERFENVSMPTIELEDLSKLPREIPRPVLIAPALADKIKSTLYKHKQVILFQNRRGYSPYQICNTCGWIPKCKQCAVSLTYHKGKNKLLCHYCGSEYPVVTTCIACGSHDFNRKKFGTEQIEEAVAALFPDARVARMDYDSVKGKYSHDALIKIFEQQKVDILIGTQMVVKGLDFEHVSLVGILDADGLLNFADFRVNERAFQLMEQVSGRAGRRDGKGEVVIQVSNPLHPILEDVKKHDYLAMYQAEVISRQQFHYPPFTRLIKIVFKHKESQISREAATIMASALQTDKQVEVLGPAQPPIDRLRNQYLWEMIIKIPKEAAVLKRVREKIQQQLNILHSEKRYARVIILPDVDPI